MLVLLAFTVALTPLGAAVDFTSQIRPLLERHCYSCHGPKLAMHGLRLDFRSHAMKGGESGVPAVIAAKRTQSLLYRYIAGLEKNLRMPPAGPALPASDVELIGKWIDEGASWPESESAALEEDPKFRRGRTHWSFQPLRRASVPEVKNRAWVRNPIDAFVLAKLEQKRWQPAPSATPQQLLRRAYFDLTGLPPTLLQQQTQASLDQVVDQLLASPSYAERWARHWLDVVRYAESNGYERDGHKPQAWKYRDYVIRSFHQDKPFDRFLTEQLAGDELDEPTPETLIATGYFRLGPWDDEPADPDTDRYDQLDDILATTSQAFLGLTLACARCHNHKFEPLAAKDYYSMIAVFDGLERPRKGRTELDRPIGTRAEIEREKARDARITPLAEEIAKLKKPFQTKEKNWESKIPADVQRQVAALEAQIAALRKETPDLPRGYFLEEPSATMKPVHVLVRGKPGAHGPEVAPAVPAILVKQQPQFLPPAHTSRRRLSLAQWLASRDNPLTARVIVNRVWMWHFGEGLVRTPSDFGLMGQRPTHPELLDWLAAWFMDNGWSLKKLHKLILSSNTWRMSKRVNAEYQKEDPENRLLWRVPVKRLEAEAIRDSILAISGRLNPTMYGPSVFPPVQPQALEGSSDPDKIWKASPEEDASRRSVYVFVKRSLILPMMEVLDLCDTARSAAQRLTTSVPTQALTLFNGDFVNQQARYLAARLLQEAGSDERQQMELAYRLAFARLPHESELREMRAFLERERAQLPGENASLHALQQLARVLFNTNELVYVD
ncbi:MAG: PSD1 domain-containing protein [Acidobacteria bacterium]|nr:PSD1 domain-containing protein [Acidobacteriota bacterium]